MHGDVRRLAFRGLREKVLPTVWSQGYTLLQKLLGRCRREASIGMVAERRKFVGGDAVPSSSGLPVPMAGSGLFESVVAALLLAGRRKDGPAWPRA